MKAKSHGSSVWLELVVLPCTVVRHGSYHEGSNEGQGHEGYESHEGHEEQESQRHREGQACQICSFRWQESKDRERLDEGFFDQEQTGEDREQEGCSTWKS